MELGMKRGDYAWIEQDGKRAQAMIALASENGASLMLMFDAMIGGYCGMMPVLRDKNGVYRDLIKNEPVKVEKIEP